MPLPREQGVLPSRAPRGRSLRRDPPTPYRGTVRSPPAAPSRACSWLPPRNGVGRNFVGDGDYETREVRNRAVKTPVGGFPCYRPLGNMIRGCFETVTRHGAEPPTSRMVGG